MRLDAARRAWRRFARGRDDGLLRLLILVLFTLHAGAAGAEVWGYVDESGAAHFATQKLDDRYQLFFKGGSSLDPVAPDTTQDDARAALARSPLYQRVLNDPKARRFAPLIEQHAKAQGLDAALVKAMIAVESAFEPDAVSIKGALGLMQVLPETGARYGLVDDSRRTVVQKLLDPAINVRIGARYLHDLLAMFANDVTLALAAYNAGEQSVRQYGNRVPPYPETREYVELVRQFHDLYRPRPPPAPKPARPALVLPAKRPVQSNTP